MKPTLTSVRASRWPVPLHTAVRALRELRRNQPELLLGVSGGADSLALAVAAAQLRPDGPAQGRTGAVVVDHQLQAGSGDVAQRAALVLRALGLDPVLVLPVEVQETGQGLEAAARTARYAAFREAATRTGMHTVATAHTADDQAEQVLLGLARGSGLRSLAGIREAHDVGPLRLVRPLLELTRADTEAICRWAGVDWWEDPMNDDGHRARVRHRLLPALEDPDTGLGPGVRAGLIRTAALAADDAAALEDWADRVYVAATTSPASPADTATRTDSTVLHLDALTAEPPAIRRRVIARAVVDLTGAQPTAERLRAVDALITARSGSSAGPIELPGVHVWRERGTEYATLLMFRRLRRAPR
ncbi:MAG: tRNA lysidine(34) synthetase TilS [Micrococcaceae bacterium]